MTFHFKKFTIVQEKTAMKVGTDGVLLGSWAPLYNHPETILDIGAGTGLLALMLAQRSNAEKIDAVEIDQDAFIECVTNMENSPWGDRLYAYHASLEEFTEEFFEDQTYDCIISNPPFYSENYTSGQASRDIARQSQFLPFEQLIACTEGLLSEEGIFSVILPYKDEQSFLDLASSYGLYPFQITHVLGMEHTEIKRVLIALTRIPAVIVYDQLIIEIERHRYTDAYKELTQDFYLHF